MLLLLPVVLFHCFIALMKMKNDVVVRKVTVKANGKGMFAAIVFYHMTTTRMPACLSVSIFQLP